MTVATQDFEGGSDNTVLTTANTNFNLIQLNTVPTPDSPHFDNAHAHGGSLAMKCLTDATTGTAYGEWDTAIGDTTDLYLRFYLYLDAVVANNVRVFNSRLGGALAGALQLSTGGLVRILRGDGSNSTGVPYATGQWNRIEAHFIAGATANLTVRVFNGANLEGTTPDDEETVANVGGEIEFAEYRFGICNTNSNITYWIDDIACGDNGAWIGPSITTQPISTLVDRFDGGTVNAALWNQTANTGTTITQTSGEVRMALAVGDATQRFAFLNSVADYDLTGSSIYFALTGVPGAGGRPFVRLNNGTDFVSWEYNADNDRLRAYNPGSAAQVVNLVYDPVAHRYCRIRESGGHILFDTSPDGTAWTNQYDDVAAIAVDEVNVEIGGSSISMPVAGSARFASVNVVDLASRGRQLIWTQAHNVPAGKSLGTVWHQRAKIAQNRNALWSSISHVTNTRQALWHVRVPVGKSVGTLWNTEVLGAGGAVGKSVGTVWNTLGKPAAVLALLWDDRAQAASDIDFFWPIRRVVAGWPSFATAYGGGFPFTWNDWVLAGQARALSWDTVSAPGVVGAQVGLVWATAGHVGATRSLLWQPLTLVFRTRVLEWEVEVVTPPAVGRDLETRWHLGGHSGRDMGLRWVSGDPDTLPEEPPPVICVRPETVQPVPVMAAAAPFTSATVDLFTADLARQGRQW